MCECLWPAAGAVSSGSPAPRAPAAPPHSDWVAKHSLSSSFLSDHQLLSHTHTGFLTNIIILHWKTAFTRRGQQELRLTRDFCLIASMSTQLTAASNLLRHFRYLNLPRDGLGMQCFFFFFFYINKHNRSMFVCVCVKALMHIQTDTKTKQRLGNINLTN